LALAAPGVASRYSRASLVADLVELRVAAGVTASTPTGVRNTRADYPGGAFGSGNVISAGRG
jgi:hypothetical protein